MKRLFILLPFLFLVCVNTQAQQLIAFYPFSTNANDSSGNLFNAGVYYGAYINQGAHIGGNDSNEVLIPKKVFNGRKHLDISFDVKFDTLQVNDSLARNTIIFGGQPICGPVPLGIFYCKVSTSGQPANSWLVLFDNKPYIISDPSVVTGTWYSIDIKKENGAIYFYKNASLMQVCVDSSDSIHITLNAELGQFSGCLGTHENKSLFGVVKNMRVSDPDLPSGINEIKNEGTIHVFPNPATDYVSIQINGPDEGPGYIQLTDLSGRIVFYRKTNVVSNSVYTMKTGDIPTGTYILLCGKGNSDFRKLIEISK